MPDAPADPVRHGPYLTADGSDSLLTIRVVPRAGRTALAGERRGALLVRLAAPPVEGAANDALVDALSKWLDVPRRAVRIASGEKSRDKRVRISGIRPSDVDTRLKGLQDERN